MSDGRLWKPTGNRIISDRSAQGKRLTARKCDFSGKFPFWLSTNMVNYSIVATSGSLVVAENHKRAACGYRNATRSERARLTLRSRRHERGKRSPGVRHRCGRPWFHADHPHAI